MVKVIFLQDFRGKLTKEQFYQAGDVAEFDGGIAQQLLEEKRVALAPTEPVEPERKTRRKKAENK